MKHSCSFCQRKIKDCGGALRKITLSTSDNMRYLACKECRQHIKINNPSNNLNYIETSSFLSSSLNIFNGIKPIEFCLKT